MCTSNYRLEQESGFFFNMKYFEDEVHNGNWEEVEKYLSGFTKVDDNRYSMKIFFEIRKQKYLEALDKWGYIFAYWEYELQWKVNLLILNGILLLCIGMIGPRLLRYL